MTDNGFREGDAADRRLNGPGSNAHANRTMTELREPRATSADPDRAEVYAGDAHIATLLRDVASSDEEWQYVVSALWAALNDPTQAASRIRAKARSEVKKFVGAQS